MYKIAQVQFLHDIHKLDGTITVIESDHIIKVTLTIPSSFRIVALEIVSQFAHYIIAPLSILQSIRDECAHFPIRL